MKNAIIIVKCKKNNNNSNKKNQKKNPLVVRSIQRQKKNIQPL